MVKIIVFYDENNTSRLLILGQNESEIKSITDKFDVKCMGITFRMAVGTVVWMLTQKYQLISNQKFRLCRILPKL